ncbi:MAG: hypothetical protein ACRENM_02890, partial [Candidatus Dormibacteraceae bacterium]
MFSVSADADLLEAIVGPVPARLRRASLSRILDSSECELAQLGLGESARRRVLACAEVARRCQPRVAERARVTSPREALVHLEPLRRQSREALAVLLLDARLHACGLRLVALGGVSRV